MVKEQEHKESYKLQLRQPIVLQSVKWKCMLCGRDKFTRKSPHNCVGGFRKRKIVWQQIESN